jgi:cohesin complex subunit SCC1
MPSRDALMLPDVLTESDNLEMPPMPDASFLFSQLDDDTNASRKRRGGSRDLNLPDDLLGSQIYLPEENRNDEILELLPMDEIDLGINFGFDEEEPSIEVGREAPAALGVEDDLLSDLGIDLEQELPVKDTVEGGDDTTLHIGTGDDNDTMRINAEGDVEMIDIYDPPDASEFAAAPRIRPERISESPLSDYDETVIQQGEVKLGDRSLFEPEEEVDDPTLHVAPQRARKIKKIEVDQDTLISSSIVKEHQRNRDKILRPQSFLPRDQQLLALIEMQKNGGFISNIIGDGRSMAWAPELRGMLSLDAIRKNGELKRKRDSGVADMDIEDEQGPQKSPRLELGEQEEDLAAGLADAGLGRNSISVAPDGTIIEVAGDDGFMPNLEEDEHNATVGLDPESPGPNFDETTAPLVHPADSGPVSLGTKHAVHLLRDRFGAEAANSPDKRKKASVLFQDLLPERSTTRADATKMFFEVLVLATKDAVKVEQAESLLGGPIRIRGKRGLWGDWAETGASGEIAEQEDTAGPSHGLEQSTAIAVGA